MDEAVVALLSIRVEYFINELVSDVEKALVSLLLTPTHHEQTVRNSGIFRMNLEDI